MKKMIISLLLCVLFTLAGCIVWLFTAAQMLPEWGYMILIPIGLVALITSCLFEEGRQEYKEQKNGTRKPV